MITRIHLAYGVELTLWKHIENSGLTISQFILKKLSDINNFNCNLYTPYLGYAGKNGNQYEGTIKVKNRLERLAKQLDYKFNSKKDFLVFLKNGHDLKL